MSQLRIPVSPVLLDCARQVTTASSCLLLCALTDERRMDCAGGSITDLEPLANVAHSAGVPLIVDNTMATPFLTRPFEHGADVVCHSTVSHRTSLQPQQLRA